MNRKQIKNSTIALIASAGVLAVTTACSSSGRASSANNTKSATPLAALSQPATATIENVSAPAALVHSVTHRAALATMRNDDFGIALEYPWQYGFKSGHKLRTQGEQVETSFVAPGGANLGTINIPAGYYENTDFERAFVEVNVNRKLTQDQCSQFAGNAEGTDSDDDNSDGNNLADASVQPDVQPVKTEVGNQEYLMLERTTDNSTQRTYHAYQNGACYEFVLSLKTNDADASDNGQALKPVSRKQVFSRLEKVLASVEIAPDAEQNAPALASAPAAGDVPPQKP
jgi:hypothetical protein